jgi:hypothetical protein
MAVPAGCPLGKGLLAYFSGQTCEGLLRKGGLKIVQEAGEEASREEVNKEVTDLSL